MIEKLRLNNYRCTYSNFVSIYRIEVTYKKVAPTPWLSKHRSNLSKRRKKLSFPSTEIQCFQNYREPTVTSSKSMNRLYLKDLHQEARLRQICEITRSSVKKSSLIRLSRPTLWSEGHCLLQQTAWRESNYLSKDWQSHNYKNQHFLKVWIQCKIICSICSKISSKITCQFWRSSSHKVNSKHSKIK